jgi:hypothetical protein
MPKTANLSLKQAKIDEKSSFPSLFAVLKFANTKTPNITMAACSQVGDLIGVKI